MMENNETDKSRRAGVAITLMSVSMESESATISQFWTVYNNEATPIRDTQRTRPNGMSYREMKTKEANC